MTSLALQANPFSIVTTGSGSRSPAWKSLAESWGSGLLEGGWQAEGDTAWQQAQAAVMRLTARVVEREMRVARAFDIVV